MNLFYRRSRKTLPGVRSLADVESALKQVRWTADRFGDWIQDPDLTWGRKKGDCEDFARLAVGLLKQLDIEAWLLSLILKPAEYSHAVCVFLQNGKWSYFDNTRLVVTDFSGTYNELKSTYETGKSGEVEFKISPYKNIDCIISRLQGKNRLIYWTMEKY